MNFIKKSVDGLEEILKSKNLEISYSFSSYCKGIYIKFYGTNYEKRKIQKNLAALHLKFDRSHDPDKNSYEIAPVDGEGNEILSNYGHKHSRGRLPENPFKKPAKTQSP
jgi:hypothetical protein